MGYVDDAFSNLKHALEITATEQELASTRRQAIYDHLSSQWDVLRVFLTGSYDRHTKTKKLKDVDIFVVVDPDGAQGELRQRSPAAALGALRDVLEQKYIGQVTIDGAACVITFGSEDEIMSFEVALAFERSGGGFEIPDASSGQWIATDPEKHAEATAKKNSDCDGKWVPFVKMVKGINRQADEPISPSFLIEVIALDVVREPFGRYQDEIVTFLASAADQIANDWPDPAGVGPTVNGGVGAWDRQQAANYCREWQAVAEEAIDLEDSGSERAAVERWRILFGDRMPRP